MALNPADIPTVSRLLDEALALPADEREAWLAALLPEHQRHAQALREMLAEAAKLDTDPRLAAMPTLPADEDVAKAGDAVGPYRLLHEIGRGGMGSVWLAERADGAYQRQLALKLPRLAWGAGLAERMRRERDIGALLEHSHIARMYDAGVDERGRPFLAMEYIDGQPIDVWCQAQGLSVRSRLSLFLQVARAVAYAHGRLVVHRDLKPSNVLVTPDGQAHLLDFGIAKLLGEVAADEPGLTQQQGRVLTPHYASPEQVEGQAITVQSDVYSLGVLLYVLLTGTLPIEAKRGTLGAVEEAILQGDAPLASSRVKDKATVRALRGEVDAILAKAMQREPARRYVTADALAQDIERHLSGETVTARPDSLGYRLRKALRRHWRTAAAGIAILGAVLTGSAVAVAQAQKAAQSAERENMVKSFVADVFRVNSGVDPKNASLRPASKQKLLEGGAQLIQQRFAGQPELQAELYGVVGGVFHDMGADTIAVDYFTRQIEVLALMRADQIAHAKALLSLAEALRRDKKCRDAESRAERAREISKAEAAVHVDALLSLAALQLCNWRGDEAPEATLRQADVILAKQTPGPTSARARATFLRARLLSSKNRGDEAVPVYEQAIETALRSEGPLSITAIDIRLTLAHRLAQTRFADKAQEHFDAAATALRTLGGAHEVRAAYETADFTRHRYLAFSQIPGSEAIATLERSQAVLNSSPLPIPDRWIPEMDFWLGAIKWKYGDIASALPLLEAGAPVIMKLDGTARTRWLVVSTLGMAYMSVGRHDIADGLLRERMQLRRQSGYSNDPYAAADHVLVAENLLMAGQVRAADTVLDEAPKFEAIRGEGKSPDRYSRLIQWARAQVRLAASDAAGAQKLLQEFPPAANDGSDWDGYRELLGETLCQMGQSKDGLALLELALAAAEQKSDHPNAPGLASLRAVKGHCAATAGDRATALREAARARAAFTAQPGVSTYYKAPLFKLERALGLKLPPV